MIHLAFVTVLFAASAHANVVACRRMWPDYDEKMKACDVAVLIESTFPGVYECPAMTDTVREDHMLQEDRACAIACRRIDNRRNEWLYFACGKCGGDYLDSEECYERDIENIPMIMKNSRDEQFETVRSKVHQFDDYFARRRS